MSWNIDNAHSLVSFTVRHMMITNVRGRFDKLSGTVNFDEQDPTRSSVDVQIDASSVNTNDDKRDEHLKSPDFFDVQKYPAITFKSTKVETRDQANGKLYGDLTIHGVTKPVVLNVEYVGQSKSPWGTTSAGFSARTKINRKDYGLEWNVALETGGMLVGEDITIDIEVEIVKQPDAQPVA
ncbi:MAG TPA: YceI family protein [Anaerolineales bacterium]